MNSCSEKGPSKQGTLTWEVGTFIKHCTLEPSTGASMIQFPFAKGLDQVGLVLPQGNNNGLLTKQRNQDRGAK